MRKEMIDFLDMFVVEVGNMPHVNDDEYIEFIAYLAGLIEISFAIKSYKDKDLEETNRLVSLFYKVKNHTVDQITKEDMESEFYKKLN